VYLVKDCKNMAHQSKLDKKSQTYMSWLHNRHVNLFIDTDPPHGIFMRVSSVYMSYDKHLHISFRYLLYLNLWEQLFSFINERK